MKTQDPVEKDLQIHLEERGKAEQEDIELERMTGLAAGEIWHSPSSIGQAVLAQMDDEDFAEKVWDAILAAARKTAVKRIAKAQAGEPPPEHEEDVL